MCRFAVKECRLRHSVVLNGLQMPDLSDRNLEEFFLFPFMAGVSYPEGCY